MSDDVEYGPWIDHDGRGFPWGIVGDHRARGFKYLLTAHLRPGRVQTPWEQANPGKGDTEHPGWTWKRSGWFGRGKWIASDPEYARIVRYRFGKPRAKSAQFEVLAEIAALNRDPVSEIEAAE
ncbi:MAG: hypothetical protein VKL39_24295 [Leptolyngbyaceae bacterium]|nr:hypothetical protein [Leptolyngbyaceae bacterium]